MSHVRRMAYLLIFLMVGALAAGAAWKPAPAPRFVGIASADVPHALGPFKDSADYEMGDQVKSVLSTADILSRTYGSGPEAVDFVLISGKDRNSLHDPRLCLTGAGMAIDGERDEPLPGTAITARACRAVDNAAGRSFDMIYFYVVDGKIINSPTQIRAAMLWNALIGRRESPTYFFRFMRPVSKDAGQAAAQHAEMAQFAGEMWQALSPKILHGGRA